jgi:hypothetical protein
MSALVTVQLAGDEVEGAVLVEVLLLAAVPGALALDVLADASLLDEPGDDSDVDGLLAELDDRLSVL